MSPHEPTDWSEIRRRLDAIRQRIEAGFSPSPEDERRTLHRRAQELAREPTVAESASATLEVVEFELGGERYALPIAHVREVGPLRELTLVPCTPAFVLGIINVRGEIRTVIDLKKFFDLPDAGLTELNKIILLRDGDLQLGILADVIRGVHRIPHGDLQTTLPTLTDIRADYLLGVTSDRLTVLDPVKILSDKRILVDEEVSS